MRFVILNFLVYFLAFPSNYFAQSEEVSFYCRNQQVRFLLEPTSLAVEFSRGKEALDGFLGIDGVESFSMDVGENRWIVRCNSHETLRQLVSRKQTNAQYFPVYVPVDGTQPVWCYGEVTVCWEQETSESSIRDVFSHLGLTIKDRSRFNPMIFLVNCPVGGNLNAFEIAEQLRQVPYVEWAEPNLYGGHTLSVSDPYRANQSYLDLIQAEEAWQITTGNPDVVVAVLDEGIDLAHPDLAGQIHENLNEIAGDGLDNDGNGFTDDVQGWDFMDNDNTPIPVGNLPINAHGTAVAGLIAAIGENGEGITGLAPDCTLLPIRIFNGGTYGGNFKASEAIRYAATYADVINCSWSGQNLSNDLMSAIDFAVSSGREGKGCVVLFASGNGGNPVSFPASYAWTVAVGETDETDLRNEGSNFGDDLTLTAPLAAWTTDNSGPGGFDSPELDYTDQFAGTSSSTPLASALAALLFSVNPGLSGTEAVMALITGLDSPLTGIAPNDLFGKSPEMGYGRINAARSLLLANTPLDDRLEPNDSPSIAPALVDGYYPWLYLEGDFDYYRLEVAAGKPILCTVQYLSLLGDLNILLKDANGAVVGTPSEVISGDVRSLHIEYSPPSNGTYYLMVYGAAGSQLPYTLSLETTGPDDSYEPNQTFLEAKVLNPGSGKTYQNLVLNDDDLYRVYVEEEQYIYALLSFNQSQGDLGLQILDYEGGVVRSSNNVTYGEQVDPYLATMSDAFYIRVFSSTGATNREYSLHLAVTSTPPIDGSGNDDPFEDNDSALEAKTLSTQFYPNLSLDDAGGEITDFYRFTVPARKQLRITIGWNGLPDLNLRLYPSTIQNNTGTVPLAGSLFRLQDLESVSIPSIPSATEYWLEINRYNSTGQTPYRLALETLDPIETSVAFYRFCEGVVGGTFRDQAIRDWRGPLLSHQAQAYSGIGTWAEGPDPTIHPGSDGIALDCSNGGIYFPGNGDRGELNLGDHDFTLWARIKAREGGDRVIGGIPGVWEFLVDNGNTLEFRVNGIPILNGAGPSIQAGEWQCAACVWDRTNNQIRVYASNNQDLLETFAPIAGVSLTGSGVFHLGSTQAGNNGIGLIEQVRYFDSALTSEQLRRFSIADPTSGTVNWILFE